MILNQFEKILRGRGPTQNQGGAREILGGRGPKQGGAEAPPAPPAASPLKELLLELLFLKRISLYNDLSDVMSAPNLYLSSGRLT